MWKSVWKSIVEYTTSLGYWGLLVIGGITFSLLGYLRAFEIENVSQEYYLYALIAALIVAPFFAFHTLRLQRDEARALLLAKPKPIPLQNRNELRGAIASVENATIQLVNRQDVLDKATAQNSYVVDTGAIARRDEAYVIWDEAMNELRRQYLIAGDKYESVCVDLTGFIWMQVWIKTGQIKYPEGDKPIVIHDILRFVGVLAGRVKDTLRKIEEISGQALDMEGSRT